MDKPIALVTGANTGIGKEIARQLAGAGQVVYVGSRDAGRGARAAEEIDGDARPLVLDVTDAASVAAAAREVTELDILVNNAGISGVGNSAPDEDLEVFRRIYETNVFAVVGVTNVISAGVAAVRASPDRKRLQRHRIPDVVDRAAVPAPG
jgi:NAD(P)-dependent dehydrogenase (short-subunit alcohol dehydrogenase family)